MGANSELSCIVPGPTNSLRTGVLMKSGGAKQRKIPAAQTTPEGKAFVTLWIMHKLWVFPRLEKRLLRWGITAFVIKLSEAVGVSPGIVPTNPMRLAVSF